MASVLRRLPGLAMAIAVATAPGGCMFEASSHPRVEDSCMVSGCSGELCADEPRVSPCIWHDAYVCYRTATCERQGDGACGWTPTAELDACLASYGAPAPQP